jgi:hypothetical protein
VNSVVLFLALLATVVDFLAAGANFQLRLIRLFHAAHTALVQCLSLLGFLAELAILVEVIKITSLANRMSKYKDHGAITL